MRAESRSEVQVRRERIHGGRQRAMQGSMQGSLQRLGQPRSLQSLGLGLGLGHVGASGTTSAQGLAGARRVRAGAADGFEARGTSAAEAKAGRDVQAEFQKTFTGLAQDPAKFHDTMKTVYGEGYDKAKAEGYRQRALAGDVSWMPKVKFLDDKSIAGANGAYDKASETVYLNKNLLGDPQKAAATYLEEAGHHLDTKLNKTDARGDEGELFRRIASGEKLTKAQIEEIKREDDKGTITVDGKQVEVEFWNPFKAIGKGIKKAAKAVGGAVSKAAKAVGGAIKDVATGVGKAVGTVVKGVGGAIKDVATGVASGVGGFFKNLVKGKLGEAGQSLLRGLDKAFLQAPARLGKKLLDGAGQLLGGVANALGPVGKPLKWLSEKGIDFAKTGIDTVSGIARDLWRLGPETALGFGKDVWGSLKKLGKGDFKGAAKDFGGAFLNAGKRVLGGAVDVVARAVAGVGSIGSSLLGFEKDMTKGALNDAMKDDLKKVYGDSIDFDEVRIKKGGLVQVGAPRTVGNTIYVPDEWSGQKNFNPDGTLTDSGKKLVMHEMGHVWQNQNGGGDYIHKSLFEQLKGAIQGGDRGEAYDWKQGVKDGQSFADMNPEQQASVLETANWILSTGQPLTPGAPLTFFDPESRSNQSLTGAEVDFLRQAVESARRGAGAP